MAAPPLRTELSDNYPNPSNATMRTGMGKLWDYVTGLLGSTGNASDARIALGVTEPNAGNLLINSNFGENQRAVSGTVTLAAGAYGHDRFKAGASGCTYTFSKSAGVTTFNITAGSLQQVVEGDGQVFTDTYTLRWTGTAQGRINSGSYGTTGVSASLNGGSNVTVEWGAGTLSQPHLRRGTTSLPWAPYSGIFGGERQACQRYYQLVTGINVFGYATSGSAVITSVPLKVSMRATPTVTIVSSGTQTNSAGTSIYGNTAECFGFGVIASATGMCGATSAQAAAAIEL